MAKRPSLRHVKFVKRGLAFYGYMNVNVTGPANYAKALGRHDAPGFFERYAAALAERTKRAVIAANVQQLAHDYELSGDFRGHRPATQKVYRIQLRRIVEAFGDWPADDVTPATVRRVLDVEPWEAPTQQSFVRTLGALYTWGRGRDRTTARPTDGINIKSDGAHLPWPDDVLEAALKAGDDLVRLGVHLLYFTGQRIGDVCALRWGDLRDGVFTVVQIKTRKTVYIPLARELRIELDRTPRTAIKILAGITVPQLRKRLKAFVATHGIRRVPHGLRKNAVNSLLEAGCSIAQVAAITGQSYKIVEQYAANVNTRKLGSAAIVNLDDMRSEQKRAG